MIDRDDNVVCAMGEYNRDGTVDGTFENAEANAKLIAATPELLAACNHALMLLSGLSTDGTITMTPEGKDTITAELRTAIAKAAP